MYLQSFMVVIGLCLASGAVPSQREEGVPRATGGCVLPKYPNDGSYAVFTQPAAAPGQTFNMSVALRVTCNPGYGVAGSDIAYCISDNKWSQPMPQCNQNGPADDSITNGATTPQYVPPSPSPEAACPAIPAAHTTNATGGKAWDKCLEYQEQLIYPCEESTTQIIGKHRSNRCNHNNNNTLIVGHQAPQRNEFPHVVWLCRGQPDDAERDLRCAGTLISDRFILTSAFCVRFSDPEKYYAVVGALHPYENITDSQAYRLKKVFKHPQYDHPAGYNNIGLVETVDQIRLGPSAVPACLDVFGGDHSEAGATGRIPSVWTLYKATATKTTDDACRQVHAGDEYSDLLPRGVDAATQVCYTPDEVICTFAAPLVVNNHRVGCMYTIVGIPTFWSCYGADTSLLYTAVASFVHWIEGIVWP